MLTYIMLAILSVLLLGLLIRTSLRARQSWLLGENLPPPLRGARLFASERNFVIHRPFELYGRPDQVYRRTGRELVIVDTKKRAWARVTWRDRVQLSLYKLLLERALNPWYAVWRRPYSVSSHAYLRCVTDKGVVYKELELLSEYHIQTLYLRYRKVQTGGSKPLPATESPSCRNCHYQEECPH